MKVSHLIKALPLLALPIVIWQWSNIKNIAVARKLSTSSEQQLATKAPNDQSSLPSDTWQVTSVSDGDTIAVVRDGTEEKIRFCGIDAPEISHGSSPEQPLGRESKDNLQKLIDEAHGEVNISIVDTDRYGRKVAEVFTVLGNQKKFLQEEQVKSGFAYHYAAYSANCPNRSSIIKAEEVAQSTNSGVWGSSYEKPWDYRKVQRDQKNLNTNITSNSDKDDTNFNSSPSPDNQDKAIAYANISLANTLEGHSDKVSSLAISPNGKTLVSGSLDRTIKIWDLSTNGSLKSTITGSSPIKSVIVSPDGQTLISGDDKTIKIWDLGSGTEKSILTDSSGADVLAVSPDGKTLVSSTVNTIKIWDLNNGTLKNTITAHSGNIKSLNIELDGQTLISGSEDETSKEWDLSTGALKKNTPWNFKDFIIAFSADRQISVSSKMYESSITINIQDVDSKSIEGTISTQASNLTSLAISPDKQTVAVSGYTNNHKHIIEVWRVL